MSKPRPTITWSNPAAITYGTPLSGTQLNATANVGGSFSYTPGSGTVLSAGSQTLSVNFTPNDTAAYDNATATATITVNKATPTLTWSNPSDIGYGTALSGTQLNATTSVSGTYSYSPASGTTLSVGNGQTLSVTFTPTDSANYNTATASATLNVTKGTPVITWSSPTAITYGTALSTAQLNATASVPGTFSYSPAAGAVVNAGSQGLTVVFTPTDTANYNSASGNVTLTVNKAAPSLSWSNPAAITFGTALSGTQLNATASVQGNFNYSPSIGTVPIAGNNQTLSVTFTPNDTANYNTATANVTVNVNKATPSISWSNPTDISYGTALSGTQLNATASVQGSFAYSPASGAVLNVGNSQTLSVTFTPTDTANYNSASATVYVNVGKVSVSINWSNPAAISYGTALSGTQLNATANIPGTFSYSPAAGAVLNAGSQTLAATFTPTDTANYNTATANVTLTVNKATPTVNWSSPAAITYGTALGSDQLNATASVQGTFVYAPATGTVPAAGNQNLSVTFTPTDAANYNNATGNVTLTVNKATPTISWSNPSAITYGTALGSAQLNATASVQGTFAYSPAAGNVPGAGNQTLSVTFTPSDTGNYNNATASVTLTVNKATPTITWSNPADLTYGTALGNTQLNATASVQGTFAYSPQSGTMLNVGNSQTLSVTFTPSDTANYNNSTASVAINVLKVPVTVNWSNPAPITYGTALSGTQLNATANIPGSFSYAPAAGAVLNAGSQSLAATFTPTDTANYNTATANVTLTVNKATPTVNWSTPGAITYGAALSDAHLNATASVPGNLAYSPPSGAVLNAGSPTLTVTFTPTDSANYNNATANVTLTVNKATPTVTWSTPAAINYGTALGTGQLNATANVPGAFAYSPGSGTIPGAGSPTLSVTFNPSDAANYSTATASVTLTVNKGTPTVAWSNPAPIGYGTALGSAQLNATASVPGSLAYTPASGTVLSLGNGQTLSVTFTPADSANYSTATASVTISVQKGTPLITWPIPSPIEFGNALSASQLNATASVPGSFAYSPATGTVLNAGSQTLSVTFSPTDAANYNTATASVNLNVQKSTPSLSWSNPSPITHGAALGSAQLNANASVSGSFSYSPGSGNVPDAGTSTLSASFTPSDTANYNNASISVSLTVFKADQTISFAPLGEKRVGDPPFSLTASASSGLPVNYSVSGPASLAGNTLALTGRGAVTVTATQPGNNNYNAAPSVQRQFNIIGNLAPTLGQIPPQSVDEGKALNLSVTATDPDVPGQTLTFSLESNPPPGASINSSTGAFSWTPNESQGPAAYNITVKVTDNGDPQESASRSFSVTVNEVNVAPTLAAIPTQSVRAGSPLTLTAAASDADQPANVLTYSLGNDAPASATINPATGAFNWTPPVSLTASTHVITIRVSDNGTPSLAASQSFTVNVTPANLAPVFDPISAQTIVEGTPWVFRIAAKDPDVPANQIFFSLGAGAPPGMNLEPALGELTWTPTEAQGPGTYAISVRASDDGTPSQSATVNLTINVTEVNSPPVLAAIADQSIRAGSLLSLTAAATDADLPANSLTFSLGAGAPAGAAIDPASGVFTWTPTPVQSGTHAITVQVTDNGTPPTNATRSFLVAVGASNTAPLFGAIPTQTVAEGSLLSVLATATDPDIPANVLTYSLGANAPAGLAINSATGGITWTPSESQGPSTNLITVQVADNGAPPLSASANLTVIVTEVNAPPVLGTLADRTAARGETVTATATATDSDLPAQALTFSLGAGAPNGAIIDARSGLFTWTPATTQTAGATQITIQVSDDGSPSLIDTKTFTVTLTNRPPTLTAIANQTTPENTPTAAIVFSVADPDGPVESLRLTSASSNPVLVPSSGIVFGGQGANRTVTITPASNQAGVAGITIQLEDGDGGRASVTFDVTVTPGPPRITQQPTDQSVAAGVAVTFSVEATGTAPLRYQWQFNGADLAGQTNPTLQLSNVTPANTGEYSVAVSNAGGSVASTRARLTVAAPPVITRQPQGQSVLAGSTVTLSVTVSGTEPLRYQWRRNGADLSGATGPNLVINNVQAIHEGDYTVVVSNAAGSLTSAVATIKVEVPVQVTSQPASQSVTAGQTTTFTVTATGTAPLRFQWRHNGVDLAGANQPTLTLSNVQSVQAGRYQVVVSNASGPVASETALLTVNMPVIILEPPQGQTASVGDRVALTVAAAGTPPLSYQWQKNGANVSGANAPILVLASVQPSDAGTYRVVVQNVAGTVNSPDAVVRVIVPPSVQTQPSSQNVAPGANVTFSVAALGDAPLIYQWQKNGANVAGAAGSTLALNNVQVGDAGNYSVVVGNAGGAVTSSQASLTLILPPLATGRSAQEAPPPIEAAEGTFDGGSNDTGGIGQLSRRNAPASAGGERWFSWKAPSSGVAMFNTVGSTFDTLLTIYTGTPPNLTEVAGDDDQGGFLASQVGFNATQGTTYLINVKGFGGATGRIVVGFKLTATTQQLPVVIAQPRSQTVPLDSDATFTVQAAGTGLRYQWYVHGNPFSGATSPTLQIPGVLETDLANFTVRISSGPLTAPLTVESVPAALQIGTEAALAHDKFKNAPRVAGGGVQPASMALESLQQTAAGAVARQFSGSLAFSTVGSSKEQGEPNHADVAGGASQWITYQAPANGVLRVATEGSNFDTLLAVYSGSGTDFASLKSEASDDNSGADGQDSSVNMPVTQGSIHFIAVDGVKGASGRVKLNYELGQGPLISRQPASQSVAVGTSVAFFIETTNALSAVTTNLPALRYQWTRDGLKIGGETNRSLALVSAQPANAGDYAVIVSSFAGTTTSTVARLTVNVALTITSQPQNQSVRAGSRVSFVASVSGTEPITYQWQWNGANIAGATNASHVIDNALAVHAGAYSVFAQNAAGSVTSTAASLTVSEAPAITVQPVSATVAAGDRAEFRVTASGTGPLSYQWRLNGLNVVGATGPTLELPRAQLSDAGDYTVVVSNAVDSIVSQPASLLVGTAPAAAAISNVRFDAVTGFQFRLSVPEGKRATVQVSGDLINWVDLKPDPFTGAVDVQDPQSPGFGVRFYRVIVQ